MLFDHGQTDVYSRVREDLIALLEAAEKPPPAAAPSRAAATTIAAQFGNQSAGGGSGEDAPAGAAGAPGPGGRGRRHKAPPSAGPAAAAEPPIANDMPSVPSARRTGATTRGGAGVQAAALGFAAQVAADVSAEATVADPPPQVPGRKGLAAWRYLSPPSGTACFLPTRLPLAVAPDRSNMPACRQSSSRAALAPAIALCERTAHPAGWPRFPSG